MRRGGIQDGLLILIGHGPSLGLRLQHLLLLLVLLALAFLVFLTQEHRLLLLEHLQHNIRIAQYPLGFREDNACFLVEVLDGVFETDFCHSAFVLQNHCVVIVSWSTPASLRICPHSCPVLMAAAAIPFRPQACPRMPASNRITCTW